MISEKQYKKALAIVEAYKKQLRENAVSGCFTLDDLVELSGTIQVPSLKEGIVDEDFASDIEEKLYQKGHLNILTGFSIYFSLKPLHITSVLQNGGLIFNLKFCYRFGSFVESETFVSRSPPLRKAF